MRTLLAAAVLATAHRALAAEPSPDQQRKIALVVDFCGAIVAQEKADVEAVAKRIPGLVLGPAKPLADHESNQARRELFRGLLKIDDTTKLQYVGFEPEPTPRNKPFAALRADGESCMVVGAPGEVDGGPLRTALMAAGSTWKEDKDEPNSFLWRRDIAGAAQTMNISKDESLMVIARAATANALAARVEAAVSATLRPCLEGILSGKPPEPGVFAPPFLPGKTEKSDGKPGMTQTVLALTDPGLQSVLTLKRLDQQMGCRLVTRVVHLPADAMLAAVLPSIDEFAAGADFRSSALPAKAPTVKSWRFSRPSASREAIVSVLTVGDGGVEVRIEPPGGWSE